MTGNFFCIDNSYTPFNQLCLLAATLPPLTVSDAALQEVENCRRFLDKKLAAGDAVYYGINTGFGYLQDVKIDKTQLAELQRNLLVSHACGMGMEVPAGIVKLMLALKIKSLCYGHSGVQTATVKRLTDMYNYNVLPVLYQQGSLGASGDLAPLSHLSLPLIGLGEVYYNNEKMPAARALELLGWQPLELQSKEGLALINGTQFMSAFGLHCLARTVQLQQWADIIAAISFDAFDCVAEPLHEKIQAIRSHKGQVATAAALRQLLQGSQITAQPKEQIQDPYSFRCIPQVHGASKDAVDYVSAVFEKEVNSVTDNPNIFPEDDLIASGGNFHGQPLALALDFLAIALSEIANISERRTYQLISGQHRLPMFLVKQPGLHSGFMIPQYTAASIVSENKQLCTPASVDSISSSNNQEDHVSMGANAATKCRRVVDNTERVLAIELLTAVQALEFRRPLKTSPVLEKIVAAFREKVSFNTADRVLHTDMEAALRFMREYGL
ncbi:MAG TPA: histidine ammonia-lyase [Ferruginibacter sp.]|nr:histidine ammonia-lyase [Ferruginibacter sp.]HMP21385.1 histidine ammonia-lyase [Ferruginibacter sp.]